jgi:enoyl-CoA hydratase/carnithine racemase
VDGSLVLYEKHENGVASLMLNRPHVLNAMNIAMRDELWSLLHAVEDDPDVRAAVVSGAGDRGFSAGADISEFGSAPSYAEARRARQDRDLWGYMRRMGTPLVAAIHGYAFGAGCELPLLCDFRIASEDAQFALPEVSLGYIPSAGGTQTLPRAVAPGLARELIYGGEAIGAERALRVGLVQRVVPRAILMREALSVASRLAAFRPEAVSAAKRTMLASADLALEDGLRAERLIALRVASGMEA